MTAMINTPWTASTTVEGWFNPFDGEFLLADVVNFDDWRWCGKAACRDYPEPEDFFRTPRETDRKRLSAICAGCPVRIECLDYALRHDEHGWWGGTSRFERRHPPKT